MRAVVTGASGGIGASLVTRLRADGYEVIAVDIAGGAGIEACDVSDRAAVDDLVARTGPIDLLVNNAAIWRFAPLEAVEPAEFERVIAVNLFGPFNLTQAFGRSMLERGAGAIVNVVSIAAAHISPYVGAYSSSKAALVALTRQTAYEWGPRGVRANAVGPGLIQTAGAGLYHDEEVVRGRAAAVPVRRLGTGDDIADAVSYLGSDRAAYVNGQVLYVDGGLSTALMGLLPGRPRFPEARVPESTGRALIVSGGVGHPFEATSGRLRELLAAEGLTSEITTDVNEALESLTAGDGVDIVAINALRWQMLAERYSPLRDDWSFGLSRAARSGLLDHVASGRGLFGVHTASICFDDWPEWGALLGGSWDWDRSCHPPVGQAAVRVAEPDDALTEGLVDFDIVDEIYGFLDLEADIEPLLTSSHGGSDHPVLWRRRVGPGRVVYDALGHDLRSYESETHCAVVRRAARWLAFSE